jgi:hypothetical protein
MTKTELRKINLSKWPEMRILGDAVTREQANEIILRTSSFCFSTNDHEFQKELWDAAGIKHGETEYKWNTVDFDDLQRFNEEMGILPLHYLQNNQIVSSWIGGPHGWCGWTGSISSSGYNIGKWPEVESVEKEWKKIAQAFSYLKLCCQLFSDESGVEESKPLVEFRVADGKVNLKAPGDTLPVVNHTDPVDSFFNSLNSCNRERGCTIERFKEAIEQLKVKVTSC